MKKVNNTFFDIHFIDELEYDLCNNRLDLDKVLNELAINYIRASITTSNGDYDALPDLVKKVIPPRVYELCYMSNKDLFEYENYVIGKYEKGVPEYELKEIITWPESQYLRDIDPDLTHCQLINDDLGLELYGSSAYLVNHKWYQENKHKLQIN